MDMKQKQKKSPGDECRGSDSYKGGEDWRTMYREMGVDIPFERKPKVKPKPAE